MMKKKYLITLLIFLGLFGFFFAVGLHKRWDMLQDAHTVFAGGQPASVTRIALKQGKAGLGIDANGRLMEVGLSCRRRVSDHAMANCKFGEQKLDYIILHHDETICDWESFGAEFSGPCLDFLVMALQEEAEGLSLFMTEDQFRQKIARLSLAFQLRQAWTQAGSTVLMRNDGIAFLVESIDDKYLVTVLLAPGYIVRLHYSTSEANTLRSLESLQLWLRPDSN